MADRSISYEFTARLDSFKAQMAAGSRAVRDFGGDLMALDRNGARMRAGLDQLGGTAGRVGLAAAAGFGAAVTAAANFEQSMSFVQAATHETAGNMDRLREAALQAGADTAFSATEAAAAIEELAKAGVSTEAILGGGLQGALDLAAAGGLEVAAAAEAAASAMTQFKLSGEDVPHIADLLAAGAGKAQGSVHDMAAALNQSGLVASQTGLTIEETTGTLAAFASAGLVGSDAGTSFKTMLQSLTPTSVEAKRKMDELGISAYDAQGNFVGMTEFAANLRAGLADLSVEQQNAAMKTIFGADAVRAASVVFTQGAGGIQDWIDKTNEAGYASETAAIRMDNFKGDLEELKGSLETAFIGAGDGQSGILRDWAQNLTGVVNKFNQLPPSVQSAAGSLLGVAAIGAGGFWFTSKAITAIANTRQALADLGIQASGTRTRLAAMNGLKLTGLLLALKAVDEAAETVFNTRVDQSSLMRNLEAMTRGETSDDLKRLGEDLAITGSRMNEIADPIREVATLFGALGDTALDKAAQNIRDVDEALASMVESGDTGNAIRAYEEITRLAADAGVDVSHTKEAFSDYHTAMANAAPAAKEVAEATDAVGSAAAGSAGDVEGLAEALKQAREDADDAVGSFLDLAAGIEDGKFSFSDWIGELERAGNAVANFRANAAKADRRGIDETLIQQLQTMGTEGALQLEYLATATDKEITRTNRAWRRYSNQSEQTAEDIANSIAGISADMTKLDGANAAPKAELQDDAFQHKRRAIERDLRGMDGKASKPKVDLDKGPFDVTAGDIHGRLSDLDRRNVSPHVMLSGVATAEAQLATLARRRVVNVVASVAATVRGALGSADGSTVPKTGQPYADRHPYLLADGEEVISNRYGQADRWRPFLKAINANRLADGGTTGPERRVPGLGFADLRGLNLATMNLRELNRALRESVRSMQRETKQRDAVVDKMNSLRDAVSTRAKSDLFDDQSVWGSGGGIAAAIARLRADNATIADLKTDISTLRGKGLTGAALDDLLDNADPLTIDQFANAPKALIASYGREYQVREAGALEIGKAAASAAYGRERAREDRQQRRLEDRLERIEKAIRQEERENRRSAKKGAGNAARSKSRGKVPPR